MSTYVYYVPISTCYNKTVQGSSFSAHAKIGNFLIITKITVPEETCHLCRCSHGICLIKDDDLERWTRFPTADQTDIHTQTYRHTADRRTS